MPALQVRDFPTPLYEELKACATANHRSIAQQTIIAVEEMLASLTMPELSEPQSLGGDNEMSSLDIYSASVAEVCSKAFTGRQGSVAREGRIKKRKQLFDELGKISWTDKKVATEDIVVIARESRDTLTDRVWLSLDPLQAPDSEIEGGLL